MIVLPVQTAEADGLVMPADAVLPIPAAEVESVRDWYIVILRNNAPDPGTVARGLTRTNGLLVSHVYRFSFKGFAAKIPDQAVAGLRHNPLIAAVEPDQTFTLASQVVPVGISRVDAAPAYKNATAKIDGISGPDGSSERVNADVAVLDSGIDNNHPDLNYAGGRSYVPNNGIDCTGGAQPGVDSVGSGGHGTLVAGIIGALDNGTDVVGVAPGVRVWSVKVLRGKSVVGRSLLCGIEHVTANAGRYEVANVSISGFQRNADDGNCGQSYDHPDPATPYHRAICASVGAGVTYVVAAGNDCQDAKDYFPAAYDEVITVSAMVDTDGHPGGDGPPLQFVNCVGDPAMFQDDSFGISNYGADVDLAAPGMKILSTKAGGGTSTGTGTSFAAPHVAGAAALYLASHPGATPAQVKQALLDDRERRHLLGDERDGVDEGVVNVNDREPGFVDTTSPTGPTITIVEDEDDEHVRNSTLYYDPSSGHDGVFRVNVATDDPESGIDLVRFPALFGQDPVIDTDPPFAERYRWTDANSAEKTVAVTATNRAGLSASSSFSVTPDLRDPSVAFAPEPVVLGPVIPIDARDGGSGVAKVEVRGCRNTNCSWSEATRLGVDTEAPYEVVWEDRPTTDHMLWARGEDNVGHDTVIGMVIFVSQALSADAGEGNDGSPMMVATLSWPESPGSESENVVLTARVIGGNPESGSRVAFETRSRNPAQDSEWQPLGVSCELPCTRRLTGSRLPEPNVDLRIVPVDNGTVEAQGEVEGLAPGTDEGARERAGRSHRSKGDGDTVRRGDGQGECVSRRASAGKKAEGLAANRGCRCHGFRTENGQDRCREHDRRGSRTHWGAFQRVAV